MTIWVDAQRSPSLAQWITETLGVSASAVRELGLRDAKDIERNEHQGIGNPELLKELSGYWSRRINEKDRLVYKSVDGAIWIAQCRTHYGDH
jgi:Txe/YoeB family toxin of toxin-antitoxin system